MESEGIVHPSDLALQHANLRRAFCMASMAASTRSPEWHASSAATSTHSLE
jgi:hypothetical protein